MWIMTDVAIDFLMNTFVVLLLVVIRGGNLMDDLIKILFFFCVTDFKIDVHLS